MADEVSSKFWEGFKAISLFLSSVVLGFVALFVNSSFNERDSRRVDELERQRHSIAKVEALAVFMPHLSGGQQSREAALFGITALGYPELAIRLGGLTDDQTASNAIMRIAPESLGSRLDLPVAEPSAAAELGDGWVYLGDFSSAKGTWKTQYLTFTKNLKPDQLQNDTFSVRRETGALNLRKGMPTATAEFRRIIKALQPDTKVKILEVKPWLTTGFMWARIALVES